MPFKNILGLRSDGEKIKYETWMIDEILKCSEDPIYFAKNYVIINSKDYGLIKFPVRDYQEELLNLFNKERLVMSLQGRQSGKSTTTVTYLLWYAIFHANKNVAILANKLDLAKEQLENLKQAYMNLPEWLQPGVISWAKRQIVLSNGSKIFCSATSSDGIRGMAINLLYLDEFAFVPSHIADEFIASVFPTISSGKTTKLIITTTANGMNPFYHLWDAAERGANSFKAYRVPWNCMPERDEAWAKEMIRTIGEIRFNQEFKCEFIGSQSTLIDHTFLSKWSKESRAPLILNKIPEYCSIWQLPISAEELRVKNWEYVASIDPAMGLYQDNTVLNICLAKSNINVTQVAKMVSNKMEIEDFCDKSMPLLKSYHFPSLIIEAGGGAGVAAVNHYHVKKEYENLVHFDPRGMRLGLVPTNTLKEYTAIFLKSYIQKKLLKVFDHDTIKEFLSFGRKGKKQWEGLGGNHDDHVMSLMWIVYYLTSPFFNGNIVESDIHKLVNDPTIILSPGELNMEMVAQMNMNNPDFHMKELASGAKYASTAPEDTEPEVQPEGGNNEDNTGFPGFRRV